MNMNDTKLYQYQREAVDWMRYREEDPKIRGGVLADEVGLGKTLMSIRTIIENPKSNTLILVPKSLLNQWAGEMKKFTENGEVNFYTFAGKTMPSRGNTICLASHSVINSRMYKTPEDCPLYSLNWDRVIIDEAHVIKNVKSVMHKRMLKLTCDIKWALTATPLMNKMSDFCNILNWIGVSKDISQAYTNSVSSTYVKRRTKEDINMPLPPLNVDVCRIPFDSDAEFQVYKEAYGLARSSIREADGSQDGMAAALVALIRMRQVSVHPQVYYNSVPDEDGRITQYSGECTKMTKLVEKLQQHPDDKALIFCEFTKEIHLIKDTLIKTSIDCLVLNGEMTLKERSDTVHSFNTDSTKKVLVIQRSIGAVGYNFQVANHVYIMSPTWNPSLQQQIIGRAHRTGQTKPVTATLFAIGENNDEHPYIEEWMLSIQQTKRTLIAKVLNDDRIKNQEIGASYMLTNKIATSLSFHDIKKIFNKKM
tara:strand:- start:77 stop:1513 length:1437 start_codon:yes stop_codon:yes gene_type:complete